VIFHLYHYIFVLRFVCETIPFRMIEEEHRRDNINSASARGSELDVRHPSGRSSEAAELDVRRPSGTNPL
jgi:hypothetical protein